MVKQVIVIRRDLNMRRGKEIAQGAHASMKWLLDRVKPLKELESSYGVVNFDENARKNIFYLQLSEEEQEWAKGTFTKVTCQVDSLNELLELVSKARSAWIEVNFIEDSGKTEFNGQPTITAIAIGPDLSEKIDKITGNLKLY